MMTEVHDYLGAERAVTSLTRDEFFGLANDNSHLLQPATVLQQALRQKVVGLKFWREQVSGHRRVTNRDGGTRERRDGTTRRTPVLARAGVWSSRDGGDDGRETRNDDKERTEIER